MPTYLFKNKTTGEIFEKWMKISQCDQYLSENPNVEKLPQTGYYGGVNDLKHKHIDDGFKDLLSTMSKSRVVGRNNNLNHWL